MSFQNYTFDKPENGYATPNSRSFNDYRDKETSNDNYSSSKFSRRRSNSREAERRSTGGYRREWNQDKERLRDSYRDRSDFSRSSSKFGNNQMAGSNLPMIDWNRVNLIPFQKSFYTESKTVSERSQKEIDEYRNQHQITIKSSYAPRPISTFEEAQFPKYISDQLMSKFKTPTPIQCQGWPAAMGGNDVIGIAQTGSGKTLSFLLPAFVHINAQPKLQYADGPIALVLAPTRELAMQIQEECQKFARGAGIYSTCVFGGADRYGQQREIQKGNHLIVATPGRLLDFLEANIVNLKRVTYLVLDEADRMLDMGFEPQIRKIISQIRPDRQTLFWSATWPREVQSLALEFCREKPVHVVIGSQDLAVNLRITQNIEVMDGPMKRYRIVKLLESFPQGAKTLIFTQTKKSTDYLCEMLGRSGIKAISIHGDKTQNQRDHIMRQFKTGRVCILIATDLAARGLDVADIRYVINYDFPMHIEDYIHRVGRTGRAGRDGVSYTFFTRDDYKHSYKLIDILEETDQYIPDDLYKIARRPIPLDRKRPQQQQQQSYSYPTSTEKRPMSQNYQNSYGSYSETKQNPLLPQQQNYQTQYTQYVNPMFQPFMNPYGNNMNNFNSGYQQYGNQQPGYFDPASLYNQNQNQTQSQNQNQNPNYNTLQNYNLQGIIDHLQTQVSAQPQAQSEVQTQTQTQTQTQPQEQQAQTQTQPKEPGQESAQKEPVQSTSPPKESDAPQTNQ